MKQLIARIDDELHAQLKQRAAHEGRSLNDLVTEALTRTMEARAAHARVRVRARQQGLLFEPPTPPDPPPLETVLALTRGTAHSFGDALDDARGAS